MFNIPTLFINLDKRKDRKDHIENQLKDFKSVERIQAIDTSDKSGYYGCVLSHIKALEYAKEKDYDEVIIFEDDFEWVDKDKFVYPEFDFDVRLLECFKPEKIKFMSWNYHQVYKAQHTGAYLIKKHFYDTLIECFKESYEKLSLEHKKDNYLDIYWFKIQKDNMFITPSIAVGRQIDGYSDIKNKIMKRY